MVQLKLPFYGETYGELERSTEPWDWRSLADQIAFSTATISWMHQRYIEGCKQGPPWTGDPDRMSRVHGPSLNPIHWGF